ncbi:signaling protein [Leptospira jelokensis]|nr:signaling protein [Leptospira jelokensis]
MNSFSKIIFILMFSFLSLDCYRNLDPSDQGDSILNLSNVDWETNVPLNLASNWEFYWNELLEPSDFEMGSLPNVPVVEFRPWTNLEITKEKFPAKGYATYRKKIKIQKKVASIHLEIYFSHLYSACKVYLNGKLVIEKGKVSTDTSQILPDRTNTTIEIESNQEELEIILQIANTTFYHGGPRSEFLIASPKQMLLFKNKSLLVEIFVFGLIFGSALYHLFFYFINRKQKSFLYFAFVCITFLIRIPFLNSKSYELFLPVLSFEFQTNLLHYVNIATFLFSISFLSELFKPYDYPFVRFTFYFGALLASFTPFAPVSIQHYFNLIYIITFLVLFLVFSIFLLIKHKKEAQGFYFMAMALFSLAVFCFLAISLNYYGVQGGLYLIIGYLFYVVFQSVSLSQYFAFAIESRANIEMKLHEESLIALSKQRAEMQLMVHDQLGANLTDLKVYVERQMSGLDESLKERINLEQINQSVISIIQSLRNQLLYIEDLNLIFENFVTGIQLTLLRRYSDVGREFEFVPTAEFVRYFSQIRIIGKNQSYFLNIFYMLYEVCTNDIKYGTGESVWNLHYANGEFLINQKNLIRNSELIVQVNPELKSIKQRLVQLKGRLHVQIEAGIYELKIYFPEDRSIHF